MNTEQAGKIEAEADVYINKHLAGLWRNDSDWYAIHGAVVKIIKAERKTIEEKDQRIKELEEALSDLYLSIVDKDFYNSQATALKNTQQLLTNKH